MQRQWISLQKGQNRLQTFDTIDTIREDQRSTGIQREKVVQIQVLGENRFLLHGCFQAVSKRTFSSKAQLTRASVSVSAVPNFFVKSIILGLAFIPTAEMSVARRTSIAYKEKLNCL
jgi:hypothetical protein